MDYKYKLGFIGAGNMAKAIVNGIVDSNILDKNEIIMSNISGADNYNGIKIVKDNNIILNQCRYVFLAIKPQVFNTIFDTFKCANCECVVSIMAGVKSDKIANAFDNKASVIRIMPNTPSAVGLGMGCIATNTASAENNEFVTTVFNAIGKVQYLDENLFDAVTSVSGSGPAYVYYFIKAMIEGGQKGGLTYEESKTLTLQTIKGACEMVQNSTDDLSILIDKVCSKGGTTIQAIDTFKNYQIDKKIIEGMDKCRIRSEELSK